MMFCRTRRNIERFEADLGYCLVGSSGRTKDDLIQIRGETWLRADAEPYLRPGFQVERLWAMYADKAARS